MIVFGAGVRRLLANSEASGVRYYPNPPPPRPTPTPHPPPPPRRRDVRITVGKLVFDAGTDVCWRAEDTRRHYYAPNFCLARTLLPPPPNPLSPRTLATLLLTSLWSDGERWLLRVYIYIDCMCIYMCIYIYIYMIYVFIKYMYTYTIHVYIHCFCAHAYTYRYTHICMPVSCPPARLISGPGVPRCPI